MGQDRGAREPGDEHEQRRRRTDAGDLLHEHGVRDAVGALAAVRLGVRDAEEARAPEGLERLPGVLGALVGLRRVRSDLLLGEATQGTAERFVLFGEEEGAHEDRQATPGP